jgi:hypothetical protein
VIDFSDPRDPEEVAFADLDGTNTWSAYTYPRRSGRKDSIPVYSNDGLSRNYGTAQNPNYPEAAYGFQRFEADIRRTELVGFNRLNPQLQERVIKTKIDRDRWDDDDDDDDRARASSMYGIPAPKGAKNRSARHWTK